MRSRTVRSRLAAASLFLAAFGVSSSAFCASALTYLQGRELSDTGKRTAFLTTGLAVQADLSSTTTGGGYFVLGGLLDGSRDRVTITGGGFVSYIGQTFYAGVEPILGQEHLVVETSSLTAWATALDSDGTLDDTKGIVYGAVVDTLGLPVRSATVSISPGLGDVFYFDDTGNPTPTAFETGNSGRYLILNVPPGNVAVNAQIGGSPAGRAYGVVEANKISGLTLAPTQAISGNATDETGAAVGGAVISWDFDTDFAAFTDGAGAYAITGLATGLDITLRGAAAGYRPALTFSHSYAELSDPSAVDVAFLSDAAYSTYPSDFGIVQAPSLGMIVGRVLGADGQPLQGATVVPDPQGTVVYPAAVGAPNQNLLQTSASGRFIIFNVPPGVSVLSAVGPGETIRSEVASTAAGSVTSGELRGIPLITVKGRILDEVFHTTSIGGAVVNLVEFPYIAVIASPDGTFVMPGVPSGEYVTFKVARTGFKNTYSFIQKMPATDLLCVSDDRSDCKDFFLISNTAFGNLYTNARLAANRGLGLVSAGVFFSNGVGAQGLNAQLSPDSGSVRYISSKKADANQITTIGAAQFFNATPSVAGMALFDVRNNDTSIAFLRIVGDAATLTDSYRPSCDMHFDNSFTNIYPCDGAVMTSQAKDATFQWDEGTNIKGQVQISTDPTFATINLTSASSGSKFTTNQFWFANNSKWKKVLKLGPTGTPIYWRVLARDATNAETFSDPFVFYLP